MGDDLEFNLKLDASDIFKELKDVKLETIEVEKETDHVIERISKKTNAAYREAIRVARIAWATTHSVITAMGGSISTEFQALIEMGLASLAVLVPIATGKSFLHDPMAMMALAQFATAGVMLSIAKAKDPQLRAGISSALSILNGVSAVIAGPYFLNRRY